MDLRKGVDPDLLKREQDVQKAFGDWSQRQRQMLSTPTPAADLKALTAEHRQLEDRYNQVQAEIRSRSPRYAALVRPEPLSLKALQKQVLDPETLLLEYTLATSAVISGSFRTSTIPVTSLRRVEKSSRPPRNSMSN